MESQRLVGSLPLELVKDFRKRAIDEQLTVQQLLELAVREFLARPQIRKPKRPADRIADLHP